MRKKRLKQLYPNRRVLLAQNRANYTLKEYTHENGSITYLNFVKHFLFNKPYKNREYRKDFARFTNQMYKKINEQKKGDR